MAFLFLRPNLKKMNYFLDINQYDWVYVKGKMTPIPKVIIKPKNKRRQTSPKYWLKEKSTRKKEKSYARKVSKGLFKSKMAQTASRNSLYAAQLKQRCTKTEKIFGDYLWENKVYFKFQKGFLVPFHRIVDFYLPDFDLIIEIDGGYHSDDKTANKDRLKDEIWDRKGYRTIRILNEDVLNGNFKDIIKHLLP